MELTRMSEEHIERTLGALEAKIDSLLSSMDDFKQVVKDHGDKIRNLELKQSFVAGMAAIVGGAASFLMAWIKEHLK